MKHFPEMNLPNLNNWYMYKISLTHVQNFFNCMFGHVFPIYDVTGVMEGHQEVRVSELVHCREK